MERIISNKQRIIRSVAIPLVAASSLLGFEKPVSADEITSSPITDSLSLLIPPGYKLTTRVWEGQASYYSRSGCLGCRADMLMANGETFNENALTLAFMRSPLNSWVLVTNLENNQTTLAKVTDRGGFETYNRIADLSLGLKNTIGGKDITPVRITLLEIADIRPTPSNRGASWREWDDEASELPWPQFDEFSPE